MGAKDKHLPGMEPKRDGVLTRLAVEYDECVHARQQAKQIENAVRDKLVHAMEKRNRTYYAFEDITVELQERKGLKVKVRHEEEEQGEE